MKKRVMIVATLPLAALLFAACGDPSDMESVSEDADTESLNRHVQPTVPTAEDRATLSIAQRQQCIDACKGGATSMEAFCRSLPPDPRLRAGCWGVVYAGEAACIGWCYWKF
jgi:hypothetical protein